MGNNPQTNGDICSQEYSGIIFLILKKKKPLWKEKGSQKLFWQTRKPWEYLKMFWEKTKMSYVILFLWASFEQF